MKTPSRVHPVSSQVILETNTTSQLGIIEVKQMGDKVRKVTYFIQRVCKANSEQAASNARSRRSTGVYII